MSEGYVVGWSPLWRRLPAGSACAGSIRGKNCGHGRAARWLGQGCADHDEYPEADSPPAVGEKAEHGHDNGEPERNEKEDSVGWETGAVAVIDGRSRRLYP